MLSNFPMVGNRNEPDRPGHRPLDAIELSDGGESEPRRAESACCPRCYRTFRWWGIGTERLKEADPEGMLSNFPMVGNRNTRPATTLPPTDAIELSDGGESEPGGCHDDSPVRCYRTFRWWGIGTPHLAHALILQMLSNFPMVGNRNGLHSPGAR